MQNTEREIKAAKEWDSKQSLPTTDSFLAGIQWQKDNAWIAVSSGQLPEKSHQEYSVSVQIWDEKRESNDIGYYHFELEQWYNSSGYFVRVSHFAPLLPAPPKQ